MENIRKALKDSPRVRWGILFLIAFVQAANYYFYDSLSPLKRLLEDNFNISPEWRSPSLNGNHAKPFI